MKKEILTFFAALVLYTKIPCPFVLTETHFAQSPRYFTLVGWIVGMFSGCVFLLMHCLFSTQLSVLLTIVFTILLTGGINEQGLSAVCNGFGKGWSKEGILAIMRDSSTGIFGVLSVVSILLFRLLSLSEIGEMLIPYAIIAGQSISRFFAVSLMYTHEYVTESYTRQTGRKYLKLSFLMLILSGVIGILPILLLKNFYVFFSIIPLLLIRWILGIFYKKWIGGFNEDCLFATQQIGEIVFYLFVLAAPWKFFL